MPNRYRSLLRHYFTSCLIPAQGRFLGGEHEEHPSTMQAFLGDSSFLLSFGQAVLAAMNG
jgi:hypothetical protein